MHRPLAEMIADLERELRRTSRPEERKLANDYLAALAPLLAAAVLGDDILRRLPVVERLLGNAWLTADAPFHDALSKWPRFRDEYEKLALSAMTVNERLSALGTLESFDKARAARNAAEIRRLLTEARVDAPSIERIIGEP